MKRVFKRILKVCVCLAVIFAIIIAGTNIFTVCTAKGNIITPEKCAELQGIDCVLVLGCGIKKDGSPTLMLNDRIDKSVELYNIGQYKLVMSGDNSRKDYDEVETMKSFAIKAGVKSEDVFMDHAGFSTYESIYRAKEIFKVRKMIIVTQKYHLYRALQIASALGVEAYGVSADYRKYSGQTYRGIREIVARTKDVAKSVIKPKSTFLGDAIAVNGNGDVTNKTASQFS